MTVALMVTVMVLTLMVTVIHDHPSAVSDPDDLCLTCQLLDQEFSAIHPVPVIIVVPQVVLGRCELIADPIPPTLPPIRLSAPRGPPALPVLLRAF